MPAKYSSDEVPKLPSTIELVRAPPPPFFFESMSECSFPITTPLSSPPPLLGSVSILMYLQDYSVCRLHKRSSKEKPNVGCSRSYCEPRRNCSGFILLSSDFSGFTIIYDGNRKGTPISFFLFFFFRRTIEYTCAFPSFILVCGQR